jgi:hypothetical protein
MGRREVGRRWHERQRDTSGERTDIPTGSGQAPPARAMKSKSGPGKPGPYKRHRLKSQKAKKTA